MHEVIAEEVPYVPEAQSLHPANEDTPVSVENFPIGQSMQSDSAELPVDARYFPAAQGVHACDQPRSE